MKIAAVDPGLTGAIVIFTKTDIDTEIHVESHKMPVRLASTCDPEYSLNVLDIDKFRSIVNICDIVITERITPYSHDSRKSSFSFGGSYHTMMASIGTTLKPMTIDPKRWKKHFALIGTKKEASIDRANEIMSHFNSTSINLNRTKTVSIALADAYLIGMYYLDMIGVVGTDTIVDGIKVKRSNSRQSVVEL